MAKRRLSDRELLIEQCLYDAEFEREGSINEGFVDDFKANLRGAGEWLKQDAKNSFRLRKKNDIKSNRTNAKISGKVKSYAGSLAKTMKDFRNTGGTLGSNIDGIDDVINRLDQVSKGIAPRGVNTSTRVRQGNAFTTTAQPQQQTQNAQPTNPVTPQTAAPAPAQPVKQQTNSNAFISTPQKQPQVQSQTPTPAPVSGSTQSQPPAPATPANTAPPAQTPTSDQAVSTPQETPDINSSNNPAENAQPAKQAEKAPLTKKEKIKWAKELGKKQRSARAAEKRQAKKDKKQAAADAKEKARRDAAREKRRQKNAAAKKAQEDKEARIAAGDTLSNKLKNNARKLGSSALNLGKSTFNTIKNKFKRNSSKRQNKEMQDFLKRHNPENDPEAYMFDSYDPYRNSKGQLQMINSIK